MIRLLDFRAHLEKPAVSLEFASVSRRCVQMSDLVMPMDVHRQWILGLCPVDKY